MKLAVMQPYLFPYIGYFQLMRAADVFVLYDDVSFIKKGWINRNRIQDNSKEILFSVPLTEISQNKLIKDTLLHENYNQWCRKFITTLQHVYKTAPYLEATLNIIEIILHSSRPGLPISHLCWHSFARLKQCFNIDTKLKLSSTSYTNQNLKGRDRILDICKQEGATNYLNLSGGKHLYDKEQFDKNGINLLFHKINDSVIHKLSIIDLMMHKSWDEIKQLLKECTYE